MSIDTTTINPAVNRQTTDGIRNAITAAGLAGALGSAGFIAGLFVLHGESNAQLQRAPVTVIECLLAGLAFIALTISLPGLAGGATKLPRWLLSTAAVGCAFIAIQAWADGSVIANVANHVSDDEFDRLGKPAFLLQLITIPMIVACLIGFITLGIIGWQRRAMPRGACVLFILAGLASLTGSFPPIGLLAGPALAWTARTAHAHPQ
jgi:hypothetical protein